MTISRDKVSAPPQEPHRIVGDSVRKPSDFSVGNLDALELLFRDFGMGPCRRTASSQQLIAVEARTRAYVNLMCGRFLGGGKKSSWALRDTEKCRLDCASNGLIVAQPALRPAAVAVEGSRPLLAALDRFAVSVGENKALQEVMVG